MSHLKGRTWSTLKAQVGVVEPAAPDEDGPKPLREIRRSRRIRQADLADGMQIGQGAVSKIENATDMHLSTLRRYVHALGGDLELTVTFPDGTTVPLAAPVPSTD